MADFYTCLYITNQCINDCGYCGFNRDQDLERVTLTEEQIRAEARVIKDSGIDNVILIGGTLPEKSYGGLIVRGTEILVEENLNPWIEFENLSLGLMEQLASAGATRYILFQETYDSGLFNKLHQHNPLKNDYHQRLEQVDLAVTAGFKEVMIGSLFGLSENVDLEIEGLVKHVERINADVSIAVPTLKPESSFQVDLKQIVLELRTLLPEVPLALSSRETPELRNKLFPHVEYIGTGGVTFPGGRTVHRDKIEQGQFPLYDQRSAEEIKRCLSNI
jgi:2-iminoacetate synthase